jgi:hypothetical protein
MQKYRDLCTTERVTIACLVLYSGGSWSTRSLAEKLGISPSGAWAMMSRLSRVLPLALDEEGWHLVGEQR